MSTGGMKMDEREKREYNGIMKKFKKFIKFFGTSLIILSFTIWYFSLLTSSPLTGGGAILYEFGEPEYHAYHTTEEFLSSDQLFIEDFAVMFYFGNLNNNKTYSVFIANIDDDSNSLKYIVLGDNKTASGFLINIDFQGSLTLCSFTTDEIFMIFTITWSRV